MIDLKENINAKDASCVQNIFLFTSVLYGIFIFRIYNFFVKNQGTNFTESTKHKKMSLSSSAATMRVLSVMRHWITKHNEVRMFFIVGDFYTNVLIQGF